MNHKEKASEISELANQHDKWRHSTLNMIASENITSPEILELNSSSLMHKYAEGWPKQRHYQGCKYFDEIELKGIENFSKLFNSDFADLRPISGTNANQAMFFGLTDIGDTLMALHTSDGGHISHAKFGSAGMHGLNVEFFEYNEEEMNIDIDKTAKKIREKEPDLVLFGASLYPFPHPVEELKSVVKEIGGKVAYDGAHVLGLIAGGQFQDPLEEGAMVLTGSTHKTFPGPQGGVILYNEKVAEELQPKIFPGVVSNHHPHHVAGKAFTAAEMLEFGEDYAKQTIENAKKFAEFLSEKGFKVVGESKGYTESHQVIVDVSEEGGGKWAAETLEEANIIQNKNLLPWDPTEKVEDPSGLRLGVQELTRLGMKERQMEEVANFYRRVIIDEEDPSKVGEDVKNFRNQYQEVKYTFE